MGMTLSLEVQIQLAGLPEPLIDQFRHDPNRKFRWDLAWPDHPARLLVDVSGGVYSGGQHVRGKGYEDDTTKWNSAVAMGYRVLIFTPKAIASGEAVGLIKRLLESVEAT